MAGARCFRYQHADDRSSDRSRVGCKGGGRCPGSGARAAGICAAQAVRTKEAGAETATQTQDRKNPLCPSNGCGRATTPIWLFCERHLVAAVDKPRSATGLASWRATVDEDGHDCFAMTP